MHSSIECLQKRGANLPENPKWQLVCFLISLELVDLFHFGGKRPVGILENAAIMPAALIYPYTTGVFMSDQTDKERDADGTADVMATLAIFAVVIYGLYFWLGGMPS